jgi:hypothetical protein
VIAVSAVAGLVWQSLQRQKAQEDEFLWRLVQRWEAMDMRERRSRVAAHLLVEPHNFRETIDVLNFLELLGYFVHSGTVSEAGAWTHLSTSAVGYWWAAEDEIAWQRSEDPTVFTELKRLVDRYDAVESKQRNRIAGLRPFLPIETYEQRRAASEEWPPQKLGKWSPDRIKDFLENEKELSPESISGRSRAAGT